MTFGPRLIYPAKAALTHARSWWWTLRPGAGDAPGDLRILLYHRVSDATDRLAVEVNRFAAHMAMAAGRGLRLLDLESAIERWQEGGNAQPVYALTFDDGYQDMLVSAAPILKRHGFTATLFIPTGAIDGTSRFTWYGEAQPPLLTWDEIRGLAREGVMRMGAHTVTHPNLLSLDEPSARRELRESKRVLEEQLDAEVETFSYPAGLYSAREVRLAREAGFRLAVTCDPGVNRAGHDLLALRRTQIESFDRDRDLRARLAGAHDRPLPLQRAFRKARYGAPQG